ncbi:hypothetical protein CR513_18022, partial [Mucuna pruriens]
MHPTFILTLDDFDKKVEQTTYIGMFCSLLYLTTSRSDIMFSVCVCACFQDDPRESHLTTVKHNFRYLKDTTNPSLWFKKYDKYMLKDYCSADYARDMIGRKSISGGCHYIRVILVSWASKRDDIIALSTIETEYIFATMYSPSFRQSQFGKNNIAPIRLDTIKPILP